MKEAALKDGPVCESKSTKWCYNGIWSWFPMQMRRRLEQGLCWLWQQCSTWCVYQKTRGRNWASGLAWSYEGRSWCGGSLDLVSIGASMRTKMKQWTLNANFFLLDTVRTNTRTLYNEVNKKNLPKFKFTWQLGKTLVTPFLALSIEKSIGLPKNIVSKMKRAIGSDDESLLGKRKSVGVEQRKCTQCLDSAPLSEQHTLKHRLRSKCKVWGDFMCKTYEGHCYFTCGKCKNASS